MTARAVQFEIRPTHRDLQYQSGAPQCANSCLYPDQDMFCAEKGVIAEPSPAEHKFCLYNIALVCGPDEVLVRSTCNIVPFECTRVTNA